MEEGKLKIVEVEKNGVTYKNIHPKGKFDKNNMEVIAKGLQPGQYVTVTKKYEQGKKFVNTYDGREISSYLVGFEYEGEDVSLFLSERAHAKYEQCGDVGDEIRLVVNEHKYTHNGTEKTTKRISFELPEEEGMSPNLEPEM